MISLEAKAALAQQKLAQLIDNSTHPEAPLTNVDDARDTVQAIADLILTLAVAHLAEITNQLVQTYAADRNTPPPKPNQPRP